MDKSKERHTGSPANSVQPMGSASTSRHFPRPSRGIGSLFRMNYRSDRSAFLGLTLVPPIACGLPMFVIAGVMDDAGTAEKVILIPLYYALLLIALWLPIAVTARRVKDTGNSPWIGWLLIPLGIFFYAYLLLAPGDTGENRYGPAPDNKI